MIEKIISGGQTGVDRAALDVALKLGLPCGGWCPKDRKAENGPIDPRYTLKETTSGDYRVGTRKNVEVADGTLILTWGPLEGGTALTEKIARQKGKPFLVIDLSNERDISGVLRWRETNNVRILNVAGPRESKIPGIHERASEFLTEILAMKVP